MQVKDSERTSAGGSENGHERERDRIREAKRLKERERISEREKEGKRETCVSAYVRLSVCVFAYVRLSVCVRVFHVFECVWMCVCECFV